MHSNLKKSTKFRWISQLNSHHPPFQVLGPRRGVGQSGSTPTATAGPGLLPGGGGLVLPLLVTGCS